jgi:hypothetical protein
VSHDSRKSADVLLPDLFEPVYQFGLVDRLRARCNIAFGVGFSRAVERGFSVGVRRTCGTFD